MIKVFLSRDYAVVYFDSSIEEMVKLLKQKLKLKRVEDGVYVCISDFCTDKDLKNSIVVDLKRKRIDVSYYNRCSVIVQCRFDNLGACAELLTDRFVAALEEAVKRIVGIMARLYKK